MTQRLDIILFGATGITGQYTIPKLAEFCKEKDNLTWGIAGRSEEKLKETLNDYEQEIGATEAIPIIIASIEDEESLRAMARRARIVINCCGPFRLYGEPVIRACIEEGTHHLDISGEMTFIEDIRVKYQEQANEKGVYIVSACGFESIPADLGVVYLQDNFKGALNSVESYLEYWEEGSNSGSSFNFGSYESAVNEMQSIRDLFKNTVKNTFFNFTPRLKMKIFPHRQKLIESWAVLTPATDRFAIKRSQRYFYEQDLRRPIQVETYVAIKSFFNVIKFLIVGGILLFFSQFKIGRTLLLKYPAFFSVGFLSREAPSEETIENSRFALTLIGEGWKGKPSNANDRYTNPPDRIIAAKIEGRNPGYGATCVCLVLAATTILTEKERMPPSGGVYPPGYAFAKTSLLEQLRENGIKFNILYEQDVAAS